MSNQISNNTKRTRIVGSAQNANALVHFMREMDYLEDVLINKRLFPRYFKENIGYLGLEFEKKMEEMLVLGNCFCDISFHNLNRKSIIRVLDEVDEEDDKTIIEKEKNGESHPEIYGRCAIAFSKSWGIKGGIQPVHYTNENSDYIKNLKKYLEYLFNSEDSETVTDDYGISILNSIKPVIGKMEYFDGKKKYIVEKNFQDEQEWRYIPNQEKCLEYKLKNPTSDNTVIEEKDRINQGLSNNRYEGIFLKFSYNDIKYIIVPTKDDRIQLIKKMIEGEEFTFDKENPYERELLISKILVLEDIGEDW